MSEVGQINVEPLVAGKATQNPQDAAEQAARVVIKRIQDAGGDSAKALEILADSKDDAHDEALGETLSAGSEDLSMPETPAAVSTNSENQNIPEERTYSDICREVQKAASRYAVDLSNRNLSMQAEEEDVDRLAKAWQSLDLKFDGPINLEKSLYTMGKVNELASKASVNSRHFFGKFEDQRRAIISDNFDQFKNAYSETSNPALKGEIYSAFLDQAIQAPFDSKRELEFCVEHFMDRGFMRSELVSDISSLTKILTGGNVARNFHTLKFEDNELWNLAFQRTAQLIEADPSEISYYGKRDLIHALVVTNSALGSRELQIRAREYIDGKIGKWGLDAKNLFGVWRMSYTSEGEDVREEFIVNNIMKMIELEKVRPGICKTLFDEFGIADFERYPEEALVAQYDNRDKDMPYGVSIDAREDHNGALGSDNDRIRRKLYADLAALGYGLRIYEADGRDVLKSLHAAVSRYGDQNKISFALIHQHGSEDAIGEGSGQAVTKTHVRRALEHADNRRVREVRDYFVENPTLILASCSTAPIGEIFKEFGFNVIAPQIPTSLRKLDVAKSDTPGELKFAGEYSNKDAAVHFANPHAK